MPPERRGPPPIVATIRTAGLGIAGAVCLWAGVQVWMQHRMLNAVQDMKAAAPDTVWVPLGDTTNCHPENDDQTAGGGGPLPPLF